MTFIGFDFCRAFRKWLATFQYDWCILCATNGSLNGDVGVSLRLELLNGQGESDYCPYCTVNKLPGIPLCWIWRPWCLTVQ